jgi:hypothetical protein
VSERLLANCSIEILERVFDEKRGQVDVLKTLEVELSFRTTKRAAKLRERVLAAIGVPAKPDADSEPPVDFDERPFDALWRKGS